MQTVITAGIVLAAVAVLAVKLWRAIRRRCLSRKEAGKSGGCGKCPGCG